MIVFPNAKINIGLNITEKREDGFHNLISCFYPVDWKDVLEIIPSKETKFTSSGIEIPGDSSTNLCLKAYYLLKEDFNLPEVSIHLHKEIPIGAGLGGGSSDAAFTIKNLNQQFQLSLSDKQMIEYAKKIGSDCAFFIKNKPVIAIEKGDEFEDVSINIEGKYIVLINPNLHISTKEAYEGIKPEWPTIDISDILEEVELSLWNGQILNDFEKHLFIKYPVLQEIKNEFYKQGAIYASMSGSGSTIYGIFDKEPHNLKFDEKYITKSFKLNA